MFACRSVAFATTYSIQEAVEKALRDNPTIAASQAETNAAIAKQKGARGSFGPQISGYYGYTRLQEKAAHSTSFEHDGYHYGITAEQPLFRGFATLASYEKAGINKELKEAQQEQASLLLIESVQKHFFRYIAAQEVVRSAEDAVERLREQRNVAQGFYDVGLRPKLDILQAEVNLSEAESQLIVAQNTAAIEKAQLHTLLGLPVESPARYKGELVLVPFEKNFEECLAQAYALRPDVLMAHYLVAAAKQDIIVSKSGFYPQVDATWSWRTAGSEPDAAGSSGQNSFSGWDAGVQAQMSLFSGGSTYYSVQEQQHRHRKVKADEQALLQQVAFEIKSGVLNIFDSYKRVSVAQATLVQAKEAYTMALARYEAQVGTNVDVLDAQAALTAAEASLTEAKASYLIAFASLNKAMGIRDIHFGL